MPIHDWTRVEPGDFHHFHLCWVVAMGNALNRGLLPTGYLARIERTISGLERNGETKRADRVMIRHGRGQVVAIIEIVSPGNKESRDALRSFVEKAAEILKQGVNLLVVDLFPPTPRDPHGIHKAIWDEFADEPFEQPEGKPLIVASYIGGETPTAYVESVGVGDELPALPIFLSETRYIPAPLEPTYQQAWADFPSMLQGLVEPTGHG